jgi:predicted regulator of Ras-like GTPase activity (Roadblock/LC7/MglB family)
MRDILKQLNMEVGVKGCIVVTRDGMVVASELGKNLQEEVVGAMASSVVLRTRGALKAIGAQDFERFVMSANYGKMVFVEAGEAYLVVVLDKNINLDVTLIAIAGAAYRIKNMGQIRI